MYQYSTSRRKTVPYRMRLAVSRQILQLKKLTFRHCILSAALLFTAVQQLMHAIYSKRPIVGALPNNRQKPMTNPIRERPYPVNWATRAQNQLTPRLVQESGGAVRPSYAVAFYYFSLPTQGAAKDLGVLSFYSHAPNPQLSHACIFSLPTRHGKGNAASEEAS